MPVPTAATDYDEQVQRLVTQIVRAVHPLRIILFGSAARGEGQPDSDIDLLVVMPDGTHKRHTMQHLYEHLSGDGHPFDVLVATPETLTRHGDDPGLIYRSILREGREVYAA
ncbi:MAG: nucleotidyltransferase domain-containing protein [Bacteroidetes bacterium]|jgi:predicted nucleotidyltransferase|nr:nucleotidyltransferase domain-containing protein [Bacteroidota bacterium]